MTSERAPIPSDAMRSLDEALATWDRSQAAQRCAAAESLRSEFLERFSLTAWPTLRLEDYALGQTVPNGTVSWWLEFRTRSVASMSGGSSFKHLIFKGGDGSWRYPSKYSSVDEAWEAIRSGFVEAFRLASEDRLEEVTDLDALHGAPALRTKALYMYFPDKLVPVCSFVHLEHFLQLLGQNYYSDSIIRSNVELLRTLRSIPALASFNNQEIGYFLYHWADPRSTTKVVKIAPGERARYWIDCLQGGYICVGWDAVGDLDLYASKDEFRAAFDRSYGNDYAGHQSTVSRKANELWTLMTLEPGDKVVANRGINEILAIGTVTEDGYRYRPDRPEYRHTLGVDWDTSYAKTISPVRAWGTTTVQKVSAAQFRAFVDGGPGRGPNPVIEVDDVYAEVERALQRRGQVILYGPPGTGKTYAARHAAVWLLDGGSTNPAASELLGDGPRFQLREEQFSTGRANAARVWFMVANPQHWSWERLFVDRHVDYAYGRLQRNYPNVRAGDLVVGYESTPIKRVVALARVTGEYESDADPAAALSLEPISRIDNGPSYDDLKADAVLSNSEPMRFRCQGTLFALTEVEADRLLSLMSTTDSRLADYARPSTPRLTRVTFHPSYTYEDFIEGFRPNSGGTGGLELHLVDGIFKRVCAAAAAEPNQSFVVLIDEINRGNIAKIFGELITLIEHDKRGQLTIRLPQSGDEFCVPKNVYIIATMNTADRSIQMLDTALRRRFRFVELMPDSETLEGAVVAGLSLSTFLDALNDEIRRKVGRERQIGHALFFQGGSVISTPEEFADTFRHELLPLVQEYLYDSYSDLAELFGSDVVDPERERVTAQFDDPTTLCMLLAERFRAGTP